MGRGVINDPNVSFYLAEEENDDGVWVYDVSDLPAQEQIVTSEFRAQMSDRSSVKAKLMRRSNKINVRIMKKITPDNYQVFMNLFSFILEGSKVWSPNAWINPVNQRESL